MKQFDAYTVSLDGVVVYVGITTKGVGFRWRVHCNRLHLTSAIANAIRKYGADAFVVEHVASAWDTSSLCDLEATLILQWRTLAPGGYNLKTGGSQMFLSDETKLKIAAGSQGRTAISPETRAKMSDAQHLRHRGDGAHGAETRAKISRASLGRPCSAETRAKMRAAKQHVSWLSPEGRQRLRAAAISSGLGKRGLNARNRITLRKDQ